MGIEFLSTAEMDTLIEPLKKNHCPKCRVKLIHAGYINGHVLKCPVCNERYLED